MRRFRFAIPAAAALLLALVFASPAYAATFDVDTFVDSADPAFQACTAAANDCSLRGAIITANAAPGADTINVPTGLYQLTIVGGDDASLLGDLDITDDLTLIGQGGVAVVDASLLAGDRSFHVTGGAAISVVLARLTVTGGFSTPGAGIQVDTGTLTLRNSTVENNDAQSNSGGGIYNNATTVLRNSTVQNNHANHDGAGILNAEGATLLVVDSTIQANTSDRDGGGIHSRGTAGLLRSTVTGNTAAQSGGGIMNWGRLEVRASTISYNTANGSAGVPQGGGGINSYSDANMINVNIINSTITGNAAPAGYGGGLIDFQFVVLNMRGSVVSQNTAFEGGGAFLYGTAKIEDTTFDTNTSSGDGGGIWAGGSGTISLSGGEVTNNTAGGSGAGLWLADMTTTISGTTLRQNTASGYGGGLYYLNAGFAPTPLTVVDATFSNNQADKGGGLYLFGGTARMLRTGIYENTATTSGGGINATDMEPLVIFNSTIAGNSSDGDGGGIYNALWGTSSIVSLSSSTISSNSALGSGGGVANIFAPVGFGVVAQVHLFNVTVAANDALGAPGSGLFTNAGQIQARNSIVGQQVNPGTDCLAVGGGVINGVGTNLEQGVSCGFLLNGVLPNLDVLALNPPGTTLTHALLAGSPAINAGPAGGCRGDRDGDGVPDVLLNNDQRGAPRAGVCDLGAYEF